MFYYVATFLLICYWPTAILTIECLQCYQELKLNSSEVLNTTRPECIKETKLGDTCMASLLINFEDGTAPVVLGHTPEQALIFSNGNKLVINTVSIAFNKNIASLTFQWIGIDPVVAIEDLQKAYNTMKTFKHDELRTKLREHLYVPISSVADLTCSNSQGQTDNCANGFCLLTRQGASNVDRRCIPQGKGTNPSGIVVGTNYIDMPNGEAVISYACNKAMCNGAETDEKVQQLLIEYGLLETKSPSPQNSAMTTIHQSIINFQWMLILIMTSLLKL